MVVERRRPVRHRPAAPAAGPGRARGRCRAGASCSARAARTGWPASAWPRWSRPPTGSSWPRTTCACGARARCSGPGNRAAATCGWRRCRIPTTGSCSRGPAGGRGHRHGGPSLGGASGAGRRDQAVPERGRGRVPVQELTGSRARPGQELIWSGVDVPWLGARHRRPEPGQATGGQAAARRAPHVGPGARVDLRHPGLAWAGSRACGGRPVLRERGAGARGASRGAASATFVDQDPAALEAVRTNLASVGLGDEPVTVGPGRAARLARRGPPSFDLALCDPPYAFEDWPDAARRSCGPTRPSSSRRRPSRSPRAGWSQETRRYGGTLVTVAPLGTQLVKASS